LSAWPPTLRMVPLLELLESVEQPATPATSTPASAMLMTRFDLNTFFSAMSMYSLICAV
jgi:hypothetical protein